jgi:hypothetical protein
LIKGKDTVKGEQPYRNLALGRALSSTAAEVIQFLPRILKELRLGEGSSLADITSAVTASSVPFPDEVTRIQQAVHRIIFPPHKKKKSANASARQLFHNFIMERWNAKVQADDKAELMMGTFDCSHLCLL